MNITRKDIDALNAIVTINIDNKDYQETVTKILKDYRKSASVPGFRKGQVPMSMIKKQYEKSIIIDEVNKLLQNGLNDYLKKEEINILGNPLPKPDEKFSWDNETYTFDFELGLAPKFEIDLDTKKKVTLNTIVADKDFIDNEVLSIQKQHGKLITQKEVVDGGNVAGEFTFEYKGEKQTKKTTIELDKIKGKTNLKKFIGKKIGDELTLKTKGLFKDDHDLMHALELDHDDAHGFDVTAVFKINEANKRDLAELNQELFDKLFGKDKIKSEEALRKEIKTLAEKQFQTQADQQFLNAATDFLIESTKFDLPKEFLIKWLEVGNDKPLTHEEAVAEYERSEKGLRYQLLEGKIATDNNLQVTYEDLKKHTEQVITGQYIQYGMPAPTEEQLKDIVDQTLSNQDEARQLSEQVMSKKLLDFYKENLKYKSKEVTYKEFVEETYK